MKADTMNNDQLETLAGKAGMYTDLFHMGAASMVYSPDCEGVTLDELKRFAELVLADGASRSRAASEPGEVARLAEQLKRSLTFTDPHTGIWYHERIDRLASMVTSPASEAQAGWVMVKRDTLRHAHQQAKLAADSIVWFANDNPGKMCGYLDDSCTAASIAAKDCEAMLASAPQPASSPVAAEGQKAATGKQALQVATPGPRGENAGGVVEAWQPIETAPKNGTHILVIDMTANTPEADKVHWGAVLGKGRWRCGDPTDWTDDPKGSRELLGAYESPTHWMPLPPAPDRGLRITEKGDDRG